MPTPTYTPLANITLGSSAASVTFSSISQAYRDLVLVAVGNVSPSQAVRMRLNSDTTASAYSYVKMLGSGTAASSTSGSAAYLDIIGTDSWASSGLNQLSINFLDYSATDKHKSVISRYDNASQLTGAVAGRWANTAAVTSIQLYPAANTFTAGSTFALYGIAA